MMRRLWILAAVGLVALLAGCSSSTGPSDAETLDDYWIQGYYAYYPPGQREITWESCVVFVRSGGADGDPVSGLSVTCNGQALSFEQTGYFGDVADIEPGEDVTFSVSEGGHSVSLTLEVPGAPSNLTLQEGSWDFSSPSGTHTLSWDNPAVVADSVHVGVAGRGVHPTMVFGHSETLEGSAMQVTLSNASMSGFSGATVVSCAVLQGVRGVFPGHSGGSESWARAGVVEDWSR